jgi:hypothetical protein
VSGRREEARKEKREREEKKRKKMEIFLNLKILGEKKIIYVIGLIFL